MAPIADLPAQTPDQNLHLVRRASHSMFYSKVNNWLVKYGKRASESAVRKSMPGLPSSKKDLR